MRGHTQAISERNNDRIFPSSLSFSLYLFMSTLANETIFETLFEEALEEIGINEDSLFYADAYKIAQQMAMNKFLSYNP